MPKPRRKPSRSPAPPRIGHYVLAYQAPDGKLQDPPIPLDQRLTDAELRELVDGVQAKLKARASELKPGFTLNQSNELPGGIKLEAETECRCQPGGPAPCPVHPAPPRAEAKQWINPPELSAAIQAPKERPVEPKDIGAALARSPAYTGPPMSVEEIDRVLAGNGIPPAPNAKAASAASAPEPKKSPETSTPDEDGWADAAATLAYKGLCLLTGACLLGAGVILGGWAALKMLPWLETTLSG